MDCRANELRNLRYVDPGQFLADLIPINNELATSDLPKEVRTLRTHELKEWRETRQGALFAYGMSHLLGQPVAFAKGEDENRDYDCATSREMPDESIGFAPIQLKEVVPEDLNPDLSFQQIIDKLLRYTSSPDLHAVIYLNRLVHFDPPALKTPPQLKLATLWVMAAVTPDQLRWGLWGDFLSKDRLRFVEFAYPR